MTKSPFTRHGERAGDLLELIHSDVDTPGLASLDRITLALRLSYRNDSGSIWSARLVLQTVRNSACRTVDRDLPAVDHGLCSGFGSETVHRGIPSWLTVDRPGGDRWTGRGPVYRALQSIYGLKQASRSWNICFHETVIGFGFERNSDESCVYKKVSGSAVVFLALYVDDILLIGNNIPTLTTVKTWLSKSFSMKDLGDASYALGIRNYRDRSQKLLGLSQKEVERMRNVPYASAIRSIMYAMVCRRPDVAFSLSVTSRYQSNPGESHWTAVKNILKYFRRTKDAFLAGYVFCLNGGAVTWKSYKQNTTADSTKEAEYMAAAEAAKEGVWLKNFITELGVVRSIKNPISLFCDNNGAIAQAKEPRSHQKTKHIKRKRIAIQTRSGEKARTVQRMSQAAGNDGQPVLEGVPEHRGDLAVALHQDSAYDWWKRVGADVPEPVQWATFDRLFHEEYILEHFTEAKREEFLKFTHGELTLPEYRKKFDKLVGFGQDLVSTMEKRCKRFMEGLRPDLSAHLITAPRVDINTLFKHALDMNAALIKKAEYEQMQGAPATPSRPPPPRRRGPVARGPLQHLAAPTRARRLRQRQRSHPRPFRRRARAQMGFATRSATIVGAGTRESAGSLRVYALGVARPGISVEIVRRIRVRHSHLHQLPQLQQRNPHIARTLIDPGSTLSYVCMPMPVMPNIPREDLDNPVIVSNPLGHSLRLTHVYHDCPLVVQGKTFPASLIELPHREFDVILGMDWLTANQAVVDCGAHTVRLRAEDGSDVLIRGELLPKAPEFISYIHARRLIRKKCEAFFCIVRDTHQEAPSRGDIPTPTLQQQIASAQGSDDFCIQTVELVSRGEKPDFAVRDGSLPMVQGMSLSKTQGASTPEEVERMRNVPYASDIGSIMYVMVCKRPDVAFSLSVTSRYQSNPGESHWTAVKNILKYFRRTKDAFLAGYVFCLNGGAVTWKSYKQNTTADSTKEAEYMAAAEAAKEGVWLKNFITGLGVVPSIKNPIPLFCDNNGAIAHAKEPWSHEKTKHIVRRYHII
ncbi:unnamed protein product [Cuscuta campestris]|uniref:Reverse transcriptase Ty1/copia-type domain-containing protein n=1 Tax=Cuscuta campestris TaxID=132261 RepID=A0A484M6T7_9ASTE|nr:unnamed protein product [Cuscuta campestris]